MWVHKTQGHSNTVPDSKTSWHSSIHWFHMLRSLYFAAAYNIPGDSGTLCNCLHPQHKQMPTRNDIIQI